MNGDHPSHAQPKHEELLEWLWTLVGEGWMNTWAIIDFEIEA